ncbi:MerR family DNA-binding protein [Rhodoplanes sp. Z2-YC6860]|uniref:MerR family DNA-binding protein n=1 Tax=Rhodoplanes sp. Z2-YC6860 TaxID=674703 RepID=UPI003FA7D90F
MWHRKPAYNAAGCACRRQHAYGPRTLRLPSSSEIRGSLDFLWSAARDLLALRGPDNLCADVKAIAQKHLAMLREQMARIIKVESILTDAVARCPGGKTIDCTLLEILEA